MTGTDILDAPKTAAPATTTGAHLKALGFLGFEVSDLAAWRSFAEEVLGLEVRPGPSPNVLYVKMDDRPYRLILTEGPADDIAFAGWAVTDLSALDDYAAHLSTLGIPFTWAEPADLSLRGVERLLRFQDPNGMVHEAYVDGTAGREPFRSQKTKGGFVIGSGGLGHIVFGSKHYPESVAFARDVLGAGLSDIIEQPIGPNLTAHITFMHVNERHHSIAFAGRAGAKKLHHFMIEVERVDDVGRARDRHLKAGLAIAQDIGQHPNDQMISYYGATPSGFLVEFGWGGVKVDIPTWTPGAYDRMSEWGHRPLAAVSTAKPPAPSHSEIKETAVSAAGDWALVITTPMGEQKADLTLAADLSGEITSMGMPEDVYEAVLEGDKLMFKADVTKPFPMTLAFALTIDGSSVSGEVRAGMLGASPVRGERA